jgi:hypothetical protein
MRTITWLVALATGCTVGADEPHHDHDLLDLSSALLVTTRDRLRICMQVDPALDAAPLASALRDDLARLRAHRDWVPAGLDRSAFEVVLGCPGPLLDTPVDGKHPGAVTTEPSPYRVHLHVLAEARAATALGDLLFARAIAELAPVDHHRVAEVSTALVVRASALGTDDFRNLALAQSLGLRTELP